MKMRGIALVEILSGMDGIQRVQMGSAAGGKIIYSVNDVMVASGDSDANISLDEDVILCMIDMITEAPDLSEIYDYDTFVTLMRLMEE